VNTEDQKHLNEFSEKSRFQNGGCRLWYILSQTAVGSSVEMLDL